MRKQLGTIVGGAIAGVFVFNIWGELAGATSTSAGGWLGGPLIVGLVWVLNHYIGSIRNLDGAVAIDMAVAIGVAGTMNGVFRGLPIANAMPTLIFVSIGAVLGGIFAAIVSNSIAEDEEENHNEDVEVEVSA